MVCISSNKIMCKLGHRLYITSTEGKGTVLSEFSLEDLNILEVLRLEIFRIQHVLVSLCGYFTRTAAVHYGAPSSGKYPTNDASAESLFKHAQSLPF